MLKQRFEKVRMFGRHLWAFGVLCTVICFVLLSLALVTEVKTGTVMLTPSEMDSCFYLMVTGAILQLVATAITSVCAAALQHMETPKAEPIEP